MVTVDSENTYSDRATITTTNSETKPNSYDLNMNLITSSLDITSESPDLLDDIPLLVSDHDLSDDETGSNWSYNKTGKKLFTPTISPYINRDTENVQGNEIAPEPQTEQPGLETNQTNEFTNVSKSTRQQLMMLLVKYIATKINNSFPPEEIKKELLLDKYLLILISRLKLSLTMFLKSMIYLFRYMDIIYLLRYLNQSNNFAHHNSMDFELKKLIIGCCKLVILQERKIIAVKNSKNDHHKLVDHFNYDWHKITGLSNQEINSIVQTIITRMNGKLLIRNIELIKLKTEMFRFVKMIQ